MNGSTSQINPVISNSGVTVVVANTRSETACMSACQS
jgi:hypothetical protein